MSLVEEVKYKILSYLPRPQLKAHFDDPVVGPWCKSRYYSTMTFSRPPYGYDELDYMGSEINYGDQFDQCRTLCQPNIWPHGFWGVQFFLLEFFADLVRTNSGKIDFNRLEIDSFERFSQLARDYPDVLAAMKSVELTFPFDRYDTATRDQYFNDFYNLVPKTIRDVDDVGIPSNVTELNFKFPNRYSDPGFTFKYSQFIPATVDLSRLTVLCLSQVVVIDLKQLFAKTTSLQKLKFYSVVILEDELQYLPRCLKTLVLEHSLRLTEPDVRLQLPESLEFLVLAKVEDRNDRWALISWDISHLHNLVGAKIGSCNFASLKDLNLPLTLKHLRFNNCLNLYDLNSLHLFKQLRSLTFDGCSVMCIPPMWAQVQFPPALEYFQFTADDLYNVISSEVPIPKEWESFYAVEVQDGVEERYLKFGNETVWPNSVKHIELSNRKLVIDSSHRFPDSLTKLTLSLVHKVLDIHKLVLPERLQELEIFSLEIVGLQLPTSLSKLNATDCKISSLTNLRSLPKLKSLILLGNKLDDSIFKEFPPSLQTVYIRRNTITQLDVSGCPQLKELWVYECKLKSMSQEFLKLPDSLEELNMNSYNGCISDSFEFPANLKRLVLYGHDIDNAFFAKLPQGLEELDTRGRKSGHYEVAEFEFPRALKVLRFEHPIDVVNPSIFIQCSELEKVTIISNTYSKLDFRMYPSSLMHIGLFVDKVGEVVGDIDHLDKMTYFHVQNINKWRNNYKLTIPVNTQILHLPRLDVSRLDDRIDFSKCKSLVHLRWSENKPIDPDALVDTVRRIKRSCSMFSVLTLKVNGFPEESKEQIRAARVMVQ